ncbi:hypothetical protein CD351_08645 [Erythrobacter sp. KY5]|uniref:DUF1826 domain-containing protein n=1 Tax=Erythrobacter sp. KY5 TaxID=2011159 RepID=UPI000DBF2E91|nr:DUF1826 domain-containing protein [Erythrobacter sp. KY5]AWW74492.1 hypothetical protein CD351_08645 [Erythrobacter sp. KY5]
MSLLLDRSARFSNDAQILGDIRESSCNLAVWKRAPLPQAADFVNEMKPDLRFTEKVSAMKRTLTEQLYSGGAARSPICRAVVEDVAMLAHKFSAIADVDALDLRLVVVTNDACRKFHADYVSTRLITTYFGTGTQWLDDQEVERLRAGEEPRTINSLATGDVGVFKGKLATNKPAIHRSPPISATGEKRLLLVLNPARGD